MTFWRSYAHLIWTTKERKPLIRPEIEAPLYACLVDKAAELECLVHAVNGIADHIHLVISIPPKHSVAWVVKNLKGSSSHFINHALPPGPEPFVWQRGYGYLTLGESRLPRAVAYVENQKEHHRAQTTHSWLERVDDDDAGPTASIIREPRATYDLFDEPF